MLCKVCLSLFRDSVDGAVTHSHHSSTDALYEAARSGCQICTEAYSGVKALMMPSTPTFSLNAAFESTESNEVSEISKLLLRAELEKLGMVDQILCEFDIYSLKRFPDLAGEDTTLTDRTDSHSTFKKIESWIKSCMSHEKCCKEIDPIWKPTRLLDLKGTGDPCLVTSKQHFEGFADGDVSEHYMTLSHCWGGLDSIPQLLQKDEGSLPKTIYFEERFKTFREAVDITRRLGIRYLWIDCLCIIQDSEDDWRREATAMVHVYQNSYCNIAATGAPDCRTGCFFSRDPCKISLTTVNNKYAIVPSIDAFQFMFESSPLLQRGWVLQERMLAPRSIHFTAKQVFFECHTLLACEVLPSGIRDPHGEACNRHVREWFVHREPTQQEQDDLGESKRILIWNRTVERYSLLSLSKPRDNLIALSGIIAKFNEPNDECLEGIWRSQIPKALLWRPDVNGTCSRVKDRAPSWSWASLDGPISMDLTESRGRLRAPMAEYLEAYMTPVGSNPTSPAIVHQLNLLGILANARFVQYDTDYSYHVRLTKLNRYPISRFPSFRIPKEAAYMRFDIAGDMIRRMTTQVLFLRLSMPCNEYSPQHFGFDGLVLRAEGGTFRRIGVFHISNLSQKIFQDLLEYLRYPFAKVIALV